MSDLDMQNIPTIEDYAKKQQMLRFTLHFESGNIMDIDTFFYRYFVYHLSKCIRCQKLGISWNKGIGEASCKIHECNFQEVWDL